MMLLHFRQFDVVDLRLLFQFVQVQAHVFRLVLPAFQWDRRQETVLSDFPFNDQFMQFLISDLLWS